MKKKDTLLLMHLRKNARVKLTKVSRKTMIPVSTLHDRLKEQEGSVIRRHATLLNFNKLGFSTVANVVLKTTRDKRPALRDFLTKHQNINSMYKINNGYDFLVEVIFKTVNDLENFLEELDKYDVSEKKVYYIIEDLKREEFMADPELVGMF